MFGSATLLALSLLALFAGPFLDAVGTRIASFRATLDGLSLTLVSGLLLFHLIPHAIEHGGLPAIAVGTGVAVAPFALDRIGALRNLALRIALLALLGVHAALDGAALAVVGGGAGVAMALAIVAHRLPVGLLVFESARRSQGELDERLGWLAIGLLAGATALGFLAGPAVAGLVSGSVEGVFEGLVAGALLHILFEGSLHAHHAPDDPHHGHAHAHDLAPHEHEHEHEHEPRHEHEPEPTDDRRAAAVGALLGGVVLVGFFAAASRAEALEHTTEAARAFLELASLCAPAVLVAYAVAGVLAGALGGPRFSTGSALAQIVGGVGYAVRSPVCSCGVLPVYGALLERRVSSRAALAFLFSAPALGIEAIALTGVLFGGPLACLRVLGAIGITASLAALLGRGRAGTADPELEHRADLVAGLRFAATDLVDHTLPWVTLGIAVAAVVDPVVSPGALSGVPAPVQVGFAALLGLPFYVCAAGATPVAAVAVSKGLSVGAALAWLLVAPILNATTVGVLARRHGTGVAASAVVGVLAIAVGVGLVLDAAGVPLAPPVGLPAGVRWVSLAVLVGLGLASLARQGPRRILGEVLEPIHAH